MIITRSIRSIRSIRCKKEKIYIRCEKKKTSVEGKLSGIDLSKTSSMSYQDMELAVAKIMFF